MSTLTTGSRPVRVIGILSIVAAAILIVAGIVTWVTITSNLKAQDITVSKDADAFQGQQVAGPLTAFAQAQVIEKHALDATGGKTYAQLGQDDPLRDTAMTASFLRASLFTSVVAYGVAVLAGGLGIIFALLGWALLILGRAPRPVTAETHSGAHAASPPDAAST